MSVYHRTTSDSAEAIMRDGFQDAEDRYMTTKLHRGVWVTLEQPWDDQDGSRAGALLVVECPDAVVEPYEWLEDMKPYREALVPAEILNRYPIKRAWECENCGALGVGEVSGCPDCGDRAVARQSCDSRHPEPGGR